MQSSLLQIDNRTVANVAGPFATADGSVDFSGPLGPLTVGSHSYQIIAIDGAGIGSTLNNTFNITSTAPIISQVAISQPTARITWNVSGLNPIASSTLQIDKTTVLNVLGPLASPTGGVNFSAPLGTLSVGTHTYLITATDTLGNVSTSSNNFTITATPGSGPTINLVTVSQSLGVITWKAVDPTGVRQLDVVHRRNGRFRSDGAIPVAIRRVFLGTAWQPIGRHAHAENNRDR